MKSPAATKKKTTTGKNPRVRAIARQMTVIASRATNIKIGDRNGYKQAALILMQTKAYQKELVGLRIAVVRAINHAKDEAVAEFALVIQKTDITERALKDAMLAFDAKESKIIAKQQATLDRQTNKKRDGLMARAQKAAAAGNHEKAEALEFQARDVISPTLAPAAPRVKGIAVRRNWTYEITDESKLPREYTMPHRLKINTVVQALGDLANIPGVTVTEEKDIAAKVA